MEQSSGPKQFSPFKILITIVFILLLISIAGFFFGPLFVLPLAVINKISVPGKSVFKIKKPVPIVESTESKMITAKEGGELSLTDPKGVLITLLIPAGSLAQDTEVKMSALAEVPIENYGQTRGNGVLIEPVDLKFVEPASVIFDFAPEKNKGPGEGESEDIQQNMEKLMEQMKSLPRIQGVQSDEITPTPTITLAVQQSIIVHVNHGNGQAAPVTTSQNADDTLVSAPVTEGGSNIPDTPTPDKGEQHAEGAASTIGAGGCTEAGFKSYLNAMAYLQLLGKGGSQEELTAEARRCVDDWIKKLEEKCRVNRMLVRRRDFFHLIELTQSLPINDQGQREEKLKKLMNEGCEAEYTLEGGTTQPVDGGQTTYNISTKVCGYLDDDWTGRHTSLFTLLIARAGYDFKTDFKIPPDGGPISFDSDGTAFANNFQYPYKGPSGTRATFNGRDKMTIHYQGHGRFDFPITITMKEKNCPDKPLLKMYGF